jgi:hypothetical protein
MGGLVWGVYTEHLHIERRAWNEYIGRCCYLGILKVSSFPSLHLIVLVCLFLPRDSFFVLFLNFCYNPSTNPQLSFYPLHIIFLAYTLDQHEYIDWHTSGFLVITS